MNWNDFFKRTLAASGLASYAQLAPRLGISDGAISHYRTGKRIPQVWVVAEALKVQGHPTPEKAAIDIMKAAALTSPERAFWKRLAATASMVVLALSLSMEAKAHGPGKSLIFQRDNCTLCEVWSGGFVHGLPPWDAAPGAAMRPPCWPDGQPCPSWCARAYHDRTVHNHQFLPGPWQGWRFAGRWLINPSGERIAPHLLDRWMYRHAVMFR